ncbi:MAG TPA: PAS domain S-box protein [Kiritimatiellia bacterium]|nr:PAS domain S-box protein [Kiritimatiellia bacterium]
MTMSNACKEFRGESPTDVRSVEARLRLFFDQSLDFLGIAGYDTTIRHVNPAFYQALGLEESAMIGTSYFDFVHPGDQAKGRRAAAELKDGKDLVFFENRFLRKGGGHVRIAWTVASDPDAELIYAVGRDVTEIRNVEDVMVAISDAERERIAQDLHDGLGQVLTGLAFKAKLIESMVRDGEVPRPEQVGELVRMANEASEQATALAHGIDPVVLQDGLVAALETLAVSARDLLGVDCRVEATAPLPAEDLRVNKQLYRIVQEAINNAVKHGGADRVVIRLAQGQQGLVLAVTDNGRGWQEPTGSRQGMGLKIMFRRAGSIGADLWFDHESKLGCTLHCHVGAAHAAGSGCGKDMG